MSTTTNVQTVAGVAAKPVAQRRLSLNITGPLFVLPALFFVAVFMIYPVLFNIYISFQKWNILTSPMWRGLGNYSYLFSHADFWQAVVNTVIFVVLAVPTQMALGLLAALLLNEALIGRAWLRGIIFSPMVVSMAAAGIIFRWLFTGSDATTGLVASAFHSIGVAYPNWQLYPSGWAMFFVVLMNTWKSAGYCMIIYIAGLQTIPSDLYEAASVDGIQTLWQKFRHITWPLLTPTTTLLVITTTIFSFRAFDPMFVMTSGGPAGDTTTIIYYIYEKFKDPNFIGIAAAAGTFLLFGVLILTAIQLWISRRQEAAIYG